MGIGYESYTEKGKLQFNSEMMTYALRYSGTAYVENRKVGNTSPTSLMLPAAYYGNLVAISGGGGYAVGYAGSYATGSGQYNRIYASNAPAGVAFDYFVFDRSNNIPPSNFGLEVRNEAGEITFSSNQRCMRVLNLSDGYDVSYGGKRLAVAQGQWSGHRISGQIDTYGGGAGGGPIIIRDPGMPDEPGNQYQYGWQNDGKVYGVRFEDNNQTVRNTHLSYDDVYIGPSSDSNQPPDYIIPPKLFVIDVTGFPVGGTFF